MIHETVGNVRPLSDKSIATLQTICQEVGCDFHPRLCIPVCCTALSVLWLALHKEKFPLLADTLQAAAGVAGKQRWALILPSSARVSLVTYTTVIAVRYPELDNVQDDLTCFGNYLLEEQSTHGGFLPVFWNAPSAYMHAATDIGSVVFFFKRIAERAVKPCRSSRSTTRGGMVKNPLTLAKQENKQTKTPQAKPKTNTTKHRPAASVRGR